MMVPGPVQAAAAVALGDDAHVDVQRDRYRRRLERLGKVLRGMVGRRRHPARRRVLPVVRRRRRLGVRRAAGREGGALVSPGEFYGQAVRRTCASPWYNLMTASSWSPGDWGCSDVVSTSRPAHVPATRHLHHGRACCAGKGKRHTGLMILGSILLVGGIVGGGAMVAKSMSNYEDSGEEPWPRSGGVHDDAGVRQAGTFTVYIETRARSATSVATARPTEPVTTTPATSCPKVSLTLVASSTATSSTSQRGTSASYDTAGFVGTGISHGEDRPKPGTYRLNVESDESDFAVSIGKNPKDDSDLLKTIGGAVALAGLVLGLMFLLLGLRRRRPAAVAGLRRRRRSRAWTPTAVRDGPPAPPSPPRHPGYRPDRPATVPTQPPIRLPEQPPASGVRRHRRWCPDRHRHRPPPNVGWTVPDDDERLEAAHDRDDAAEDLHLVGVEDHRLQAGVGRDQRDGRALALEGLDGRLFAGDAGDRRSRR